jgi:hypothetical protein
MTGSHAPHPVFFRSVFASIDRTEYTLRAAKKSPCEQGDARNDSDFSPAGVEAMSAG